MGDHNERDTAVFGHFQHAVQHLLACAGVEVACRLIGKNDLGTADERAGNADALLLAAAHLGGQVVGAAQQTHGFQLFAGAGQTGLFVHTLEHQRQGDVLRRRHGGQQVVALKNEPQVLLAELGQLVLGHFADLVLSYVYLAGRRLFQPGQLVQQRGLAAARLADDTAELALFYRQIDIIQRNDALLADGIDLAQLLCTDDWCQTHTSLRAIYHILYHISTMVGRWGSCKICFFPI